MTRLLILIFTLNSFMIPLSAQDVDVCDMMKGSSSMSVMMADGSMSDMNCDMHDGVACNSIQCVSSCAVVPIIPLVSSDGLAFLVAIDKVQLQRDLAFYYSIVHPIYTPPPLV